MWPSFCRLRTAKSTSTSRPSQRWLCGALLTLHLVSGCRPPSSNAAPSSGPAPPTSNATSSLAAQTQDSIQARWLPSPRAVQLTGPAQAHWYRSTSPIQIQQIGEVESRATIADLGPQDSRWVDQQVPEGVTVYYAAHASNGYSFSQGFRTPTPDITGQRLKQPRLEVNKATYILQLFDGSRCLKRYPVAFGADPIHRKLHQDNRTTPEGRYCISNLQTQATYYRALDLDYPTAVDRARYQLLAPSQGIGGEIQIHGRGIAINWTWGCIAMLNEDMDELFSLQNFKAGCPVWIYGGELTRQDLLAQSPAGWSPLDIGQWQQNHHLTPTCIWDQSTQKAYGQRATR